MYIIIIYILYVTNYHTSNLAYSFRTFLGTDPSYKENCALNKIHYGVGRKV